MALSDCLNCVASCCRATNTERFGLAGARFPRKSGVQIIRAKYSIEGGASFTNHSRRGITKGFLDEVLTLSNGQGQLA